jgi:hypothetical protein
VHSLISLVPYKMFNPLRVVKKKQMLISHCADYARGAGKLACELLLAIDTDYSSVNSRRTPDLRKMSSRYSPKNSTKGSSLWFPSGPKPGALYI